MKTKADAAIDNNNNDILSIGNKQTLCLWRSLGLNVRVFIAGN